jgi:hemolysin III
MRGRIHQVAFFLSIPAGIVLIVLAKGAVARTAAIIYAVSLSAVFGASASYHVGTWSAPALRRMKRLDHSMIFVLIAGS